MDPIRRGIHLYVLFQGTITRSSQPMVGIKQNRSVQDEKLVEAVFQSHYSPELRSSNTPVYGATSTNLIVDARPTANAMANTARGAGTENMEHYRDAKKVYSGIDHIHAMRESLGRVVDALREADTIAASVSGNVPGEAKQLAILDRQALRRSAWLRHMSNILEAVVLIVRNVHIHSSHVLIHCSDGWDRTSQLAALAQLCLDPYYRTMRGFQVLVEKDWISFGHRFLDRCGHLSSEKFFTSVADSGNAGGGAEAAQAFLASVQNRFASQHHVKETSPTFHQFLECLRQIQRQYPERFEFNELFLRTVHYHLYSCQFGTFLYNCERQRRRGEDDMVPSERTAALWDFLNSSPQVELHKNPLYDPSLDDPSNREPNSDMGVLIPNAKDVRFWHELYGRTDEEMNGKIVISHVKEGSEFPPSIEGLDDDAGSSISRSEVYPSTPLPPSTAVGFSPPITPDMSTGSPPVSDGLSSSFQGLWSSLPELGQKVGEGFLAAASSTGLGGPSTPVRPSSPSRVRSTNPTDFFANGGVKSVWGKLSSNATAAFSAVQEAYDGVTKTPSRGLTDHDEGNYSRRREPRNPDASRDDDFFISRGSAHGSSYNPWDSTKHPRSFAVLPADNPWASVRSSSPRPLSPSLLDIHDSSHLPEDPTIARPRQPNLQVSRPSDQSSGARPAENNVLESETSPPVTDPLGVGLL